MHSLVIQFIKTKVCYPTVPCMLVMAVLASAQARAADAAAWPASTAPNKRGQDLNLLITNLTLDGDELADTLYLYEIDNDVMLPVGELARKLTIGVTVDPLSHVASGFILKEDAGFRIDPATGKVTLPDHQEDFDPRLVRWIDGDLYVASRLLSRWWPVDFKLNMASLNLQAVPREKLPIQLRLEREKSASRLGGRGAGYLDPGYPRLKNPYRLLTPPVIDSTIGLGINRNGDKTTTVASYSGMFSGDLLDMEATGYATISKDNPKPTARITLSRTDPEGGLLGPLNATSVQLGNIGLPALKNVLSGGGVGWGSIVSNRPLNQSSGYGLQTLRGELPPGWDVTLYFNEALIAFSQSRGDGLYELPDQPLVFGRNEIRLVFNGPLGQRRVETQVYMFDETVTKPGELYYTAGAKQDNDGAIRSTMQVDAGVAKGLSVTAGSVYIDKDDGTLARTYFNGGLRASVLGSLVNLDYTKDILGGNLTELGLRTAIMRVSLDAFRTWINDFASDLFGNNGDPLKIQDQLRLTGTVILSPQFRLPFAVDFKHEQTVSGVNTYNIQPRLSGNAWGASFTNSLTYLISPGQDNLSGTLRANRRVAGVGFSGQIAYTLQPNRKLDSFAMTFDKTLGEHNRINLGIVQSFGPDQTTITAGWTRNFGSFGVGFSGLYYGPRNMGLGIQLFTAFGRNPSNGHIMRDWRPMAGMGAVAVKVFLDSNLNGNFDQGEEPVENAGFTVNGSGRQGIRTDAKGEALLPRLQPRAYADVALDLGSLDDAQWQPTRPGVRVLPRPGKVQVIDFPVALTAEIDGTVYLMDATDKRGIGNVKLQLVDANRKVVGETKSSSDGYYIIPNVIPGRYKLRIEPEQLKGIGLNADRIADVEINPKADFVNGIDFTLSKTQ
jgi:hypothetical protein